ncbi:MAG: hypothetical protein HY204_00410 [Nitrospirae bacterium]|nr:hypothetical protein [Nitrospirota bacterium]
MSQVTEINGVNVTEMLEFKNMCKQDSTKADRNPVWSHTGLAAPVHGLSLRVWLFTSAVMMNSTQCRCFSQHLPLAMLI